LAKHLLFRKDGNGITIMPEATGLEQLSSESAVLLQGPAFGTHNHERSVTRHGGDKLTALGSHELDGFGPGHTRELAGESHPLAKQKLSIETLLCHRLFLPDEHPFVRWDYTTIQGR
jgi:hypothetical protein